MSNAPNPTSQPVAASPSASTSAGTLAPALVPQLSARSADVAASHASAVQLMFDRISPTYDLLNRLLSFGIDRRWRVRALRELARDLPDGAIVDLCAGTLDLSVAIRARWPARPLLSLDFARDMLIAGRPKLPGATCVVADALHLPIKDGSLAGLICGFGVRNLSDPRAGLAEMARVLKPGGVCVVLEFFRPESLATKLFHAVYGGVLLPLVGRVVSGDGQAYAYLSRSMQGFMSRTELEQALRELGFEQVQGWNLSFGVASIIRGVRGPATTHDLRSAT